MSGKQEYRQEKREIKRRYLRRAFEENRGGEAIAALNRYYNNITKTLGPSDDDICGALGQRASGGTVEDATLEKLKKEAGNYVSATVRAFNMVQYLEGSPHRIHDRSKAMVHPTPKGLQ